MNRVTDDNPATQIDRVATVLNEALALLASSSSAELPARSGSMSPSLFEQCIELCRQVGEEKDEPIRTIHHLSCTGGTLIAKCLAAMPNVLLLNEVDPLSTMAFKADKPDFAPTDLVSLLRQGNPRVADTLLVDLFVQNLAQLHARMSTIGKRLVLRDHSHSHFLVGSEIPQRPTLLQMVADKFSMRPVTTVRDPIDSFLALQSNGWYSFTPFTFDEYCQRYLRFIDAYTHVPCVKYEDFIARPGEILRELCAHLDLPFVDTFADTFDVFHFSGDSGRSGNVIEGRPRRPVSAAFVSDALASDAYHILIDRLGYEAISS